MPRKYEAGTWEGPPNFRWVKMYHGERHRIHCADLGIPRDQWTKEGSYQAANAWWRKRRAEVDGPEPNPTAVRITQAVEQFIKRPVESQQDLRLQLLALMNQSGGLPDGFHEAVLGGERMAQIRQGVEALMKPPTVATEKSGGGAGRYLDGPEGRRIS